MKKYCKSYYIYRFLVGVLVIIFFAIISFPSKETENPDVLEIDFEAYKYIFAIAFGVIIVYAIYLFILYKKEGYEVTKDGISTTRGFIFKRKCILTYDKMHAINKKQGIIQKMFNVVGLYIDSGSTTRAHTAEIIIFETPEKIEEIIKHINDVNYEPTKQDETVQNDDLVFEYSTKDKFMVSLMNGIIVTVTFAVLALLLNCFINLFVNYLKDVYLTLVLVFAASLVITLITSLCISFIGHYNFKVSKNNDELLISHGLFVKVDNKLPLSKIKAVRIEQGLIRKLFGYVSLKIDVVGYGNGNENSNNKEAGSVGLLIPNCKLVEMKKYLEQILPEYIPLECNLKSKAYIPHVTVPVFVVTVIMLLLLIPVFVCNVLNLMHSTVFIGTIVTTLISYVIIVAFILINGFLKYKNAKVAIKDDKLTISTGAFVNQIAIVKKENIVAVENVTTYLRKKKGIYSYRIHIHSNALTNVIKVDILDDSFNEDLVNFLNY